MAGCREIQRLRDSGLFKSKHLEEIVIEIIWGENVPDDVKKIKQEWDRRPDTSHASVERCNSLLNSRAPRLSLMIWQGVDGKHARRNC